MIDFTRRRFLFGLTTAPAVVVARKYFIMPKEMPEWSGLVRRNRPLEEAPWANNFGMGIEMGPLTNNPFVLPDGWTMIGTGTGSGTRIDVYHLNAAEQATSEARA